MERTYWGYETYRNTRILELFEDPRIVATYRAHRDVKELVEPFMANNYDEALSLFNQRLNLFKAARELYCTSVDDAKMSIKKENNIEALEMALYRERESDNRKSLVMALESRIRKLKRSDEHADI